MRPENWKLLGDHDVILASHPGSGTSWVSTLLVELGLFYASGHDELLLDSSSQRTGGWIGPELTQSSSSPTVGLPRPSLSASDRRRHLPTLSKPRQRGGAFREPLRLILSNHSALSQALRQPVVLLVRDGRDALLSLYHYLCSFASLEVSFDAFLAGNGGAWPPPAMSWAVSISSWLNATSKPHLHVLRFEDGRAQPELQFAGLLEFLGVQRTPAELSRAIASASYASMQKQETMGLGASEKAPRIMRSGKIGEWRETYNTEQLARFRGLPRRVLEQLAYPVESIPTGPTP